jgi:hypothetical protein
VIVENMFIVAYLSDLIIADVDDWDVFCAQGLEVPETLTAISGSGVGRHLYYSKSWRRVTQSGAMSPVPRLARATLPGNCGEVRWVGVVAAPPSAHVSGGTYAWLDPETPVAPAPTWLSTEKTAVKRVAPSTFKDKAARDRWSSSIRMAWFSDVEGLGSLGLTSRPVKSFAAAARAGQMISIGILDYDKALELLIQSARRNGWSDDVGEEEVERQLRNGLHAGMEDGDIK